MELGTTGHTNNCANTEAVGLTARTPAQPLAENPAITLIYCKGIDPFLGEVFGFAIMAHRSPAHQNLWNLIYVAPGRPAYLAAHELGHTLTKQGHRFLDYETLWTYPRSDWPGVLDGNINLMRNSGKWDDITNGASLQTMSLDILHT